MKNYLIILVIVLLFRSTAYGQPINVDSLQQIVALNKQDDTQMKALLQLAINCSRSNPGKAKNYLARDIEIATAAENFDRQCSAYALFLTIYQEEGNTDSANYCINKLKTVAEKAPADKKVQGNYNQAMGLYFRKKGDYKAALPHVLAAVKFTEASNDKKSIAGQWLNAGNVYQYLGDYKNAMDCFLKALRLFEEVGNKLGEAFCYTNIANIYNNLEQYKNALNYAEKSLELKKLLEDKRGVCTALQSIGEAYMGLKKMPQAFTKYEAALQIALEEKMPREETVCYFNMGKIYASQNKDSLAIYYLKKSKDLSLQLENKLIAANAEMELAALYKNADSIKSVEKNLVTSLQTFKNAGSLDNEAANSKRLSEFYNSRRQYDKALEYSNKYHDIKDSISGANVQVQLKNLEEQYNSVKKEKEINLLKKDKELQQQEIKQQRLLLFGSVFLALLALGGIVLLINRNKLRQRMKELELRNQIAADLHDEVGSSLSSIHMLSQMATRQGNETTHKDILARMSSNAKETMDKMGDIVWMIKPGEAESSSLKQRMERFAYEISSSRQIEIKMELDEIENCKLSMEQRKNIYLIFKEAMNNAVKYSDTEKIEISSVIQNKKLVLTIKDFGKGFETSTVKKGNGLYNMQNRAKELGGNIMIDSEAGKGTTIRLTFGI